MKLYLFIQLIEVDVFCSFLPEITKLYYTFINLFLLSSIFYNPKNIVISTQDWKVKFFY